MSSNDTALAEIKEAASAKHTAGFINKIASIIGGRSSQPWYSRSETPSATKGLQSTQAIQNTTLLERAQERERLEAARHQRNIEAPIIKALPNIREDAKPDDVEEDWLINFFDKCRIVSNEEMQNLWAQILAGEVNNPGSFSIRTVNFLATLSQSEALLFRRACSLISNFHCDGEVEPYILLDIRDIDNTPIDNTPTEFTFSDVIHLDSLGLIQIDSTYGYGIKTEKVLIEYHGETLTILKKESAKTIPTGSITLTQLGEELASITQPDKNPAFLDYWAKAYKKQGLKVQRGTANEGE